MTLSRSRKQRAAATQRIAAEYLQQHGWPHATAVGAGAPGVDVLNTGDLAIEIKARRDWSPTAWLKQAVANAADGQLPVSIARPDGFGPSRVAEWPVILRFSDAVRLFRQVELLGQVTDALASNDDMETIQNFIVDAQMALANNEVEVIETDDEIECEHVWPGELDALAPCTRGCGTEYGEWSA